MTFASYEQCFVTAKSGSTFGRFALTGVNGKMPNVIECACKFCMGQVTWGIAVVRQIQSISHPPTRKTVWVLVRREELIGERNTACVNRFVCAVFDFPDHLSGVRNYVDYLGGCPSAKTDQS